MDLRSTCVLLVIVAAAAISPSEVRDGGAPGAVMLSPGDSGLVELLETEEATLVFTPAEEAACVKELSAGGVKRQSRRCIRILREASTKMGNVKRQRMLGRMSARVIKRAPKPSGGRTANRPAPSRAKSKKKPKKLPP